MEKDAHVSDLVLTALLKKDEMRLILLMDHYGAKLYGLINRVLPDTKSRNCTYVKVLETIIDNIGEYDMDKERLFTWMYKITRKQATAQLRLIAGKPKGYIYRVFDGSGLFNILPTKQFLVFASLHYFDNTVEDVANEFNMTIEGIMKIYRVALKEVTKRCNR